MTKHERAYWLVDKIPALGDYAKEAAQVLLNQADEIERLQNEIEVLKYRLIPLSEKQLDDIRFDERDQLVSNDTLRAVERAHGIT